jgi:hypothetical protein
MPETSSTQTDQKEDYMHGAAIIDEKGSETPITEDMIEQALNNVIKACNT